MNENTYKNLTDMLSKASKNAGFRDSNSFDNFNNTTSNFANNKDFNANEDRNNFNFDFNNIDMETIGKIGNIMNKFKANASNPRSNLLLSLKPYLKPTRRDKIYKYIQFINMASILDNFNSTGGEK